MELSPLLQDAAQWFVAEWSEKLCSILGSMTDEKPAADLVGAPDEQNKPSAEGLVWSQCFAHMELPALWLVTPAKTSLDLGRRTLEAAGLKNADVADSQNTYLEILNQSMSALGQSLTARLGIKADATEGERLKVVPDGLNWTTVSLDFSGAHLEGFWFAASEDLLQQLAAGPVSSQRKAASPAAPQPSVIEPPPSEPEIVDEPVVAGSSRTFDLLLDVALPVSISFGRTFLPIKEVLKLNSGSIVELDRAATEPVEVIVNNCVIARGEVVVVEGNYGVRIQQIASRHDRLRTGTASTQAQHALVTKQ